jgi:Uma2 family endonuclease
MTDTNHPLTLVEYPDSDGEPTTESDPTRDYLIYAVEALDIYFSSRRQVYVSGNLFLYYREGDPKAVVSPDVFVVFGVSKRKRRSYKLWEEDYKVPSFILEVTSLTTKAKDENEKPKLYASLGVQEYFQYDPTADYLNPQLKGSRLVDGNYQAIAGTTLPDGIYSIHSEALGLDLRLQTPNPLFLSLVSSRNRQPKELRFYDPQTGEKLLSHRESEEARQEAEQAKEQAEQAKEQAEQERLAEAQARWAAIPRLRSLGLTPEQIAEALSLSLDDVTSFLSD